MFGPPKATPKSIAQKVFEAAGDIYESHSESKSDGIWQLHYINV